MEARRIGVRSRCGMMHFGWVGLTYPPPCSLLGSAGRSMVGMGAGVK